MLETIHVGSLGLIEIMAPTIFPLALPSDLSDEERTIQFHLENHVRVLSHDIGPRHTRRPRKLDAAAQYIESEFRKLGVEIKNSDGTSRWSTAPKAPEMLLGVTVYPKIYKLINETPGLLQLPVSGRKTFYLYASDKGLLSDPRSRLVVTATFSDKTTFSTEIMM
jgi:hypothetical protein